MKGRRSHHYEALRTLGGDLVPPPRRTDEETKAGEVQGHPGRTTRAASGTGGILLVSKIHTLAMHHLWMPPGPTHFLLQVRRLRLRETRWLSKGCNLIPRGPSLLLPLLRAASLWVAEEKVSPK